MQSAKLAALVSVALALVTLALYMEIRRRNLIEAQNNERLVQFSGAFHLGDSLEDIRTRLVRDTQPPLRFHEMPWGFVVSTPLRIHAKNWDLLLYGESGVLTGKLFRCADYHGMYPSAAPVDEVTSEALEITGIRTSMHDP